MESDVSEVLPGLYLGSLSALKYLNAMDITHVLSVVNFPIQKDLKAYEALQLPLQDSAGVNMLQYLPAAIKFLDAALSRPAGSLRTATAVGELSGKDSETATAQPVPHHAGADIGQVGRGGESVGGGEGSGGGGSRKSPRVLVHCQAGVSRSAAVVAAWLMRSRGMTADAALSFIRGRRPGVDPNEGFRAQLSLFEDMRCSLDASHPVYRMWCLEELASQYEEQGYVDPLAFGQLPEGPAGLAAAVAARQTLYRCRKCRQLLATSAHVIPVEAAIGHRNFRRRRHAVSVGSGGSDVGSESCLFVEPLQWMVGSVTGVVAGKLHCPKCAARLGSFNWSGISNPSGAWVTPAFQLHHSKLDAVLPTPLEALVNVRQPLLAPRPHTAAPAAAGPTATAAATSTAASTDSGASASGAQPVDDPAAPAARGAPTTVAIVGVAAPSSAPSLPTTLPAALRRMGLGRAGGGCDEEDDEEQLPEPQLDLDPPAQQPPEGSEASCRGAAGPGAPGSEAALDCSGAATLFGRAPADAAGAGSASGEAGGCTSAWFTHLILDCDGVMVDSEAASCEALRRAILEVTGLDIPHTFPEDYVEVFGMDVRSCVAHYRERFCRTDWEAPEVVAPRVQAAKEVHYKALTIGGIRAFDGAERLIRRALAVGMQVGVASSGAPEKIAHNLSSSGLAPLVPPHAIVSAAQVAAGKPAPDVYLAAMEATGCRDPRRALVVEDAVNGLKAARAAGMFAVGITNQLPALLLAPWADLVVGHLDQVDPAGLMPPGQAAAAAAP